LERIIRGGKNMKEKTKSSGIIVCVVTAIFILAGCASIVSKSNWPMAIRSTPDQADISIMDTKDGTEIFKGKTPAVVTLSSKGGYFKGKSYTTQISKEGFNTQIRPITSDVNGWYFGNILFGGLIGMLIVDPLTGAMWTLDPQTINAKLESKTSNIPSDLTKPLVPPPEKPTTLTPVTPPMGTEKIATVTWTFANIRSGAGNDYPVVTTVKQGDKLTVIGEFGEWFNVRLESGQQGWISNGVVK
jgi:uncharacterized protein YgiM (DUF1202 family)